LEDRPRHVGSKDSSLAQPAGPGIVDVAAVERDVFDRHEDLAVSELRLADLGEVEAESLRSIDDHRSHDDLLPGTNVPPHNNANPSPCSAQREVAR
jgi:hypothetical protein